MFPILLKIGPLTIRTYGLLLAAGFALGIAVAAARAVRRGIDPEAVLDVGFYSILSGIVGARILYVIQFPGYYLAEPLRIFKIWEGGLIFYGGLILAVAVIALYLHARKIPKMAFGDLVAPSLALGQGIGRLGCFSAGCCYGAASGVPWAVIFKDPFSLAPLRIPLHPAQLYFAAADLAMFLVLLLIDRRKRFDGQVFTSYLILYAVVRFLLEFSRGDDRGSFLGTPLSSAQGIGVIVFVAGVVWWALLRRNARRAGVTPA